MIRCDVTYSLTPSGFSYDLNSFEQKASEVYIAYNGVKDGTSSTRAGNRESVSKIIGSKGVRDISYVGIDSPQILGRKPYVINSGVPRAFIPFKNIPDCYYSVDLYVGGNRQYYYYDEGGYACTFVMMLMPGQSSEAWINDYGSRNYMGELNGLLRVGTEPEYRVGTDSMPALFRHDIIHVEYKKPNIQVWRNGVFVGEVTNNFSEHTGGFGDLGKLRDSIGVGTNMANINFFAMYQWYTPEMSYLIANRDAILGSIGAKWLQGQMETSPYAKDLTTNYNSGTQTYSVGFTAMNATSGQISATSYAWYLRIDAGEGGAFSPQVLVGTNATLLRTAFQSYLDNNTAIWLNCQVEVGGTGTWTTCASPYTRSGITE